MKSGTVMKADTVIKSDTIFDSIAKKPFPGFVAVKGNRIIGVGDQKDAAEYTGNGTKILDCGDKLVMAGFHDSHTHLLMAGMFRTYVNLINARSEEEAALMVREAADKSPNLDGWVIGFCWHHVFWDNRTLTTKASLDRSPGTHRILSAGKAQGMKRVSPQDFFTSLPPDSWGNTRWQ